LNGFPESAMQLVGPEATTDMYWFRYGRLVSQTEVKAKP
jgi:hypothetical protein